VQIITDGTREAVKVALFRHLIKNGVHHDEELWFVIHEMFGVNIPHEVCVPEHKSFWEMITDDFFHRVGNQAVQSGRGCGKTFNVGVAKSVKALMMPGLRVSNFAATEQQGNALFRYAQNLYGPSAHPELLRYIDEVYGSQIKWVPRPVPLRNPAKPEGSLMKVLVGTLKGVNSSHVDDLVVDERAQMEDKIFQESMGMMTPCDPYPGTLTVISSVKAKGDPMDVLMTKAEELGFKPYLNSILDVLVCKEKDCNGCKKCVAKSEDGKQEKSFYDFCQGRALGRSLGHYSVAVAQRKFLGMGLENATAQIFCEEPEGEERAFPQFRFEKHVRDLRASLAGRAFFILGDFGKRDHSAFLKAYLLSNGVFYIDAESIGAGRTIDGWIPILKEIGFDKAVAWIVDVAGTQTTIVSKKSAIEYLEDEGWTIHAERVDELSTTDRLRDLLRDDRFAIHPDCKKTIEALNRASNQCTGQGDNKIFLRIVKHNRFSHPIDALRYGVAALSPDDRPDVDDSYSRRGR
jgi:hypothetical protein